MLIITLLLKYNHWCTTMAVGEWSADRTKELVVNIGSIRDLDFYRKKDRIVK